MHLASTEATIFDGVQQQFLSLFPRRDQFIWKSFDQKRWQKSKGPLLDNQILGVVSDEGRGLFRGCYWSHRTRHAVLDVDAGSKYHSAGELRELASLLAAVGLTAKPYQSSDSGGWHLYLFLDDWVESEEVTQTLKGLLRSRGYDITCGQLEVFPSGNALRLPLQRGFAWLNEQGDVLIRREQLALDAALKLFLSDFKNTANNWDHVKTQITTQLEAAAASVVAGAGGDAGKHEEAISTEGFDGLFAYKVIQRNYDRGCDYWHGGLTEKNQRHDAILCVEHYLWHGDPVAGLPALPGRFNDKTRFRLIRSWLEQKHNGHSWQVAAGNWRAVEADIERACTWRGDTGVQVQEPYPCTERAQDVLIAKSKQTGRAWTMDDLKKGNDRRERSARSQIRRAVRRMQAAGEQLGRNAIAEKSGCSPNTVSKHRDLWDLLGSGSGDQSRGLAGGQEFSQPGTGVNENCPLQLVLRPERGAQTSSEENFLSLVSLGDSRQLEVVLDQDRFKEITPSFSDVLGPVFLFLSDNWLPASKIFTKIVTTETTKAQPVPSITGIRNPILSDISTRGNYQTLDGSGFSKNWKTPFILPYGANRNVTLKARVRAAADLILGGTSRSPPRTRR